MNRLENPGSNALSKRYFLRALMGHSSSSSLSTPMKSTKEGILNSSNLAIYIEWFISLSHEVGNSYSACVGSVLLES